MLSKLTRRVLVSSLSYAVIGLSAAAHAQVRTVAVPQAAPTGQNLAERAYLDHLGNLLAQNLGGKSVGYAVVAMLPSGASVTRSGGDARRAPDPFPRAMSVDDKITIASVSKTMTAAAALKLLARRNISVDAPVWPYLPSTWNLGANAKTITFRELLTHRAGIRCETAKTYPGVRDCFEAGIDPAAKAEQTYNNMNYAAFRLLIPRLDGMPEGLLRDLDARERGGDYRTAALAYAERYQLILNREVFAPAGLPKMECRYTDARPALSYKSLNPNDPVDFSAVGPGDDWGDHSLRCGSAGWFFSARQLAVFMHTLTQTSKVLPTELLQQMKVEQLGLWARSHGGEISSHNHGGFHPASMNRGQLHTFVGTFSNGLTVGLVINSPYKGKIVPDLVQAIRAAGPANVAGKG